MSYAKKYSFILFFILTFFITLSAEVEPDTKIDIPMRDGFTLPTDVYFPLEKQETYPIILIRTPSGKKTYAKDYLILRDAGYAVAIQDTRSAVDEKRGVLPWVTDGWGDLQDGYDSVEWLGKSSFSNGQIGTMGFSAMGITQLLLAPTAPPSLKAQYIGFSACNLYHHAVFHGGQLRKMQVEKWLGKYAKHPAVMRSIFAHGENGPLWKMTDFTSVACKVTVPALHYGGWYDTFSQGTLDTFMAIQDACDEKVKKKHILVMGPWTHHYPRREDFGDFVYPEQAKMPPFPIHPISWFDYYLKGKQNEVSKLPNVIYYVMGPFDGTPSKGNVWKTAPSWPIPAHVTPFYLSKSGTLSKQIGKESDPLSFQHDPNKLVPTKGGRNLFLQSGPMDQRENETRSDVITFTSDPLEYDVEVTGRILADIYFSTDQEDTDVVVNVMDVYPDGKSVLIVDGIRSMSNVNEYNGSNDPHLVQVDLWSTSHVFAKGHCIRVSISSSNFPRFEKNRNNGKEQEIAHNAIFFGKKTPSQILLPIVEEK